MIVVCGRCGGFLLAENNHKTRTCPYCGSKVILEKAKKVAYAKSAVEASSILRKLKSESALKRRSLFTQDHAKVSDKPYSSQNC
jgi:DNA-directed RNA polymerase subunit RPC12/RpoP